MDSKLTLHYFPGSYFSSKALMVLYEKHLVFDEVYVNIRGGEQRAEWFMKINPKGEVPALKHGEEVIVDSEKIIDYVDKVFPQAPNIVPEVTSQTGNEVQMLREMLNSIKIDHVTYGVFANEKVRVGEIKFWPKFLLKTVSKSALEKEYSESIKQLKEKLANTSEMETEILWKIKDLEEKRDVVLSQEKTVAALETLEPIFDKLEQQLQKTKLLHGTGNDEFWLTGKDFTAADITMSILLFRMWFIGLDERYFTVVKRPNVYEYYNRVQQRSSFQKMAQAFNNTTLLVLKGVVGGITKSLFKLSVIIGLIGIAAYAVKKVGKR